MFLLTGPLLEFYKFKIIMLEYPDYSFVIQSYVKYVTVVAYARMRKKRIISPLKKYPDWSSPKSKSTWTGLVLF